MNANDGNTGDHREVDQRTFAEGKIVAFGATRVTGGFSAKNQCDGEEVRYVVPVRTFDGGFPKKRKRSRTTMKTVTMKRTMKTPQMAKD